VTVAPPVLKKVTSYVYATGNALATQYVDVTPRVKGVLDSIEFKDGQRVRGPRKLPADDGSTQPGKAGGGGAPSTQTDVPGDLLFVIDPRPFAADRDKAKADLELNLASEKQAVLRLERLEDALKGDAIAELDVIQQRALVEQVHAQVASSRAALASAELQLEFAHIRAPVDGRISRTKVTVGNLVGDQAPLATIVLDKPIYVYIPIADRDLLEIRKNGPLDGTPIEIGLANETGYPHAGKIDYADPYVDSKTGTVTLRGVYANDDEALLSGIFVRVRIALGAPKDALCVSDRAIGADQGQKYVLVVNDKNVVEYRGVKVGAVQDGLRVIEEGLKPEERIVVNGILRARPGATVDPRTAAESKK
jgi:RND family efflux transporter MFP subunit